MLPAAINQIIFKGTHNSYVCKIGSNDPPVMNHSPDKQMDEFGVWALELDVGVKTVNGLPTVLIGHDEPGDATCFIGPPFTLASMLRVIAGSAALQFRPVFLFFDVKTWTELDINATVAHAIADVRQIFPDRTIDLAEFFAQNQRYPTIPEIAGFAVVYAPGKASGMLQGTHADHCTSAAAVARSIATGQPVEGSDPNETYAPGSARVFRLDQYQADWTFDYSAPANPILVDFSSQSPRTVTDAGGDNWFCGDNPVDPLSERGQFQVVQRNHGTYAFPYKTVLEAVDRAKGIVPGQGRDDRRSGFGWTVLIRPGSYPGPLTIDIALILKKDDRFSGPVVLGR
jgi:hypothetical protein